MESGLFRATKSGAEVAAYDGAGSFGELALMYNCPRAATVTGEWFRGLHGMQERTAQGLQNCVFLWQNGGLPVARATLQTPNFHPHCHFHSCSFFLQP